MDTALWYMKETIMESIQEQLRNLSKVDTKELGEAIDMVKDLSEAIYYCTVTKAMEENNEKESERYYTRPPIYYRDMDYDNGKMYYDSRTPYEMPKDHYSGYKNPTSYPIELRDHKEGQSPLTRKTYMEHKIHGNDKAIQMQDLEKYMQELSQDIIEMIEDSSTEEKQMLQKKLSVLATKIV